MNVLVIIQFEIVASFVAIVEAIEEALCIVPRMRASPSTYRFDVDILLVLLFMMFAFVASILNVDSFVEMNVSCSNVVPALVR